jgi:glycine/D-amino acid oxidase-like deaminating enzyme
MSDIHERHVSVRVRDGASVMEQEVVEMTEETGIVVVGGGIAGLIASAHAARQGVRVVLVDPQPLGGRARSPEHHGFTLNQGAHALYPGALRRELAVLGVSPTGAAPWVDRGGVRTGDDIVPFPTGALTLATSPLLGVRGKMAIGALLGRIDRVDPSAHVGRTVDEWLDTMPDDAAAVVRMIVRVTSYTDAPALLDAGAAISQLQLGLRGVTYVDGGWQSIVDALRHVASSAGVDIRDDAATSVRRDSERVVVSTAAGDLTAAATVVAAGGPGAAAELVGKPVPGAERLGPPVEAAVLDVATETIASTPVLLAVDKPLYWSVHAPVAHLTMATASLGTAMHYLPVGTPRPPHEESRRQLEEHARVAGADVDGAIFTRFLRAMTVHHAVPTAASGGLAGRPAVSAYDRDASTRGIFLAGDWVGSNGMLADAAATSAVAAARAAVDTASAVTA